MILSLISAVAKNGVIGNKNELIWQMPSDMKHFRDTTSGHTVIMGRKTFESIGRPLPNRHNIVITRDLSYSKDGITVVNSLEEALRLVSLEQGKDFEENQEEVEAFVIGGGEIYRQSMEIANKLYLTEIDKDFEGDTKFPEIKKNDWHESSREHHEPDEKNPYPYDFVVYNKKTA